MKGRVLKKVLIPLGLILFGGLIPYLLDAIKLESFITLVIGGAIPLILSIGGEFLGTRSRLLENLEDTGLENIWKDADTRNAKWKDIEKIFESAKNSITICALSMNRFHDGTGFVSDITHLLKNSGKQFKLKILLLNPYSDYAAAHTMFRNERNNNMEKEICKTISVIKNQLEDAIARDRRHCIELTLTNYLPRFRTIIVDDESCYISLYTYGSDVKLNPQLLFKAVSNRNNCFKTIHDSVEELFKRRDNITIIKDGKFNIDWKKQLVQSNLKTCLHRCHYESGCKKWKIIKERILGYPEIPASPEKLLQVVPKDYQPGTFLIGERSDSPLFLYEEERKLSLQEWVQESVEDDLKRIQSLLSDSECEDFDAKEISDEVYLTLQFHPTFHKPLTQLVWQQEYSDIFRRIEMLLIKGNTGFEINCYQKIFPKFKELSAQLIKRFAVSPGMGPKEWCLLSVAAGLIGLNEKSIIEGTSGYSNDQIIPFNINESISGESQRIFVELEQIIKRPQKVDFSDRFIKEVQNGSKHIRVAVFPCDYIETIFLMKFYEILLQKNKHLTVEFIPKSRVSGNDATYKDVEHLLNDEELFLQLKRFREKGRFEIHSDGPKIGGLNLERLPESIIELIIDVDLVDIRGARAFEMSQGLRKDTYYGFAVCREISASVTGLDSESRHLVFLRQGPGEKSFDGFRERHLKTSVSPSGKEFMVATSTVLDYVKTKN